MYKTYTLFAITGLFSAVLFGLAVHAMIISYGGVPTAALFGTVILANIMTVFVAARGAASEK